MNNMKHCYRLTCRDICGGMSYCADKTTGKRTNVETTIMAGVAIKLFLSKATLRACASQNQSIGPGKRSQALAPSLMTCWLARNSQSRGFTCFWGESGSGHENRLY